MGNPVDPSVNSAEIPAHPMTFQRLAPYNMLTTRCRPVSTSLDPILPRRHRNTNRMCHWCCTQRSRQQSRRNMTLVECSVVRSST